MAKNFSSSFRYGNRDGMVENDVRCGFCASEFLTLKQLELQNLLSVWGNHDADAATAWIENLPADSFQVQAAHDLLSVLSDNN